MEAEEELYELIDDYLSGSLSGEQLLDFEKRLKSDHGLEEEVQLYKEVNKTIRNQEVFEFARQWESVRAEYQTGGQTREKIHPREEKGGTGKVVDFRLGSRNQGETERSGHQESGKAHQEGGAKDQEPKKKRSWTRWVGIAATIALLAVVGIWLTQRGGNSPKQVQWATAGQTESRTLSDGSRVELAANSKLTYTTPFSEEERKVVLEGEGHFEISKDPHRPFRVSAGGSITEVLGTVFTIRTDEANHTTWISVAEGKVSFANENAKEEGLILIAGEKAKFEKESGSVSLDQNLEIGTPDAVPGPLEFDNDPVSFVLDALEKHYGVRVELASKEIGKCSFSGPLDGESLEADLQDIADITGLKKKKKGEDQFILTGKCK